MEDTARLEKLPANADKLTRQKLVTEITEVIIKAVNLSHVNASDITADTPLSQNGLELDSVDILETVIAIEQHFQVKIKDASVGRKHFASIGTVADFIIDFRNSN
jgi:acyl carrier protein